jgi:hypothetical protein
MGKKKGKKGSNSNNLTGNITIGTPIPTSTSNTGDTLTVISGNALLAQQHQHHQTQPDALLVHDHDASTSALHVIDHHGSDVPPATTTSSSSSSSNIPSISTTTTTTTTTTSAAPPTTTTAISPPDPSIAEPATSYATLQSTPGLSSSPTNVPTRQFSSAFSSAKAQHHHHYHHYHSGSGSVGGDFSRAPNPSVTYSSHSQFLAPIRSPRYNNGAVGASTSPSASASTSTAAPASVASVASAASALGSSGMVKLNVGGHIYCTTIATLTREPCSMLAAMFSGRFAPVMDSYDCFFIDRYGTIATTHIPDIVERVRLALISYFAVAVHSQRWYTLSTYSQLLARWHVLPTG